MAANNRSFEIFGKTLNADGTLRCVSPSQAITFQRCGLRWYFGSKAKLPKKPMSKGALVGEKGHAEIETFTTTGQDVRGPLALMGASLLEPYLRHLPFMGGSALVEGALDQPKIQTPGGVLLSGFFDLYVPDPEWPTVIDHKFKKSLDKWGYLIGADAYRRFPNVADRSSEDQEKLKGDPQTVVYGAWALTKTPTAQGVIVRHHQHQTGGEGGRFALPAEVRLTRDDLLRRFGVLAEQIDGPMASAARIPYSGETPEGIPYNEMACGDFGGCDFAKQCKHSPSNQFASLLRGTPGPVIKESQPSNNGATMSLLNQIQKPAAPSPTPSEDTKPVAQMTQGETAYIEGVAVKFEGVMGTRAIFRKADRSLQDLPADARVATKAPAPKEAPKAEEPKKAYKPIQYEQEAAVAPPDVAPETAPVQAQVPAAPEAPAPAEEPKKTRKKAEKAAPEAPTEGLTLLINCDAQGATSLSTYVRDLAQAIAQKHGTPDLRLARKESDLAFGGWKAILSLAALQNPPKGLCSITSGELADPVIEALTPVATMVVRGVR